MASLLAEAMKQRRINITSTSEHKGQPFKASHSCVCFIQAISLSHGVLYSYTVLYTIYSINFGNKNSDELVFS